MFCCCIFINLIFKNIKIDAEILQKIISNHENFYPFFIYSYYSMENFHFVIKNDMHQTLILLLNLKIYVSYQNKSKFNKLYLL